MRGTWDQRAKVYIIYEEYFIEWHQCIMKLQSLIKYSYAHNESLSIKNLSRLSYKPSHSWASLVIHTSHKLQTKIKKFLIKHWLIATWLKFNYTYRALQIYAWQNWATPVPESLAERTCRLIKTSLLMSETTVIT